MNPYIEKFKTALTEHPPEYGYSHAHSLLDMLYNCYSEHNPTDSTTIRKEFAKLEHLLQYLALKENDAITDIVTDLCSQFEHLAFISGVRVGMQLFFEFQ